MAKQTFIKLSGWALILGGISLVLGSLASLRPSYDPYSMLSLPIDQYANAASWPLILAGILLLSIGSLGILLRYADRASDFGRYSLGTGTFFGLVSIASLIFTAIHDTGLWWNIFSTSVAVQFLGLTFFGIDALRQCILPRWNGLPILAGVWIPLLLIINTIRELIIGGADYPQVWTEILLILTLSGLVGLGIVLQSDAQPGDASVPAA